MAPSTPCTPSTTASTPRPVAADAPAGTLVRLDGDDVPAAALERLSVHQVGVADPAAHVERCLRRMGLAMDPRVLSPEQNARAVFTLSHEQVRRPISGASIGRWRNYAFAFDGSWDAIAAAHDARRAAGVYNGVGISVRIRPYLGGELICLGLPYLGDRLFVPRWTDAVD